MKLVETVVTDRVVRIWLADDPDPLKAQSWIDCQLLRSELKLEEASANALLGGRHAPERQAILETVRAAIDSEIERLKGSHSASRL